jgi:hypothetical protein
VAGVDDITTKSERTYGVLDRLARTKLAVTVVILVTGLLYMDHYKRIDQDVVVYIYYGMCVVAVAYLVMQGLVDHAKERNTGSGPTSTG